MPKNLSIDEISIDEFCDIHGVSNASRFAMKILYKNDQLKTYDEWFEVLKIDFPLADKKDFNAN